jgi:hypothetical protein
VSESAHKPKTNKEQFSNRELLLVTPQEITGGILQAQKNFAYLSKAFQVRQNSTN